MQGRGHGALLIIRIAAIGATLLFVALLLTTLALVIPGNLEILPPALDATSARFEDGQVFLDTTLGLGNHGYHDITDLSLFVRASVEGLLVTDYVTPPVTVPTGVRTFLNVSVPVNLAPVAASGALLFRPADVAFTLGINGTTTRNFIDFGASFTFEQPFEPLIRLAQVDLPNSTLNPNGTEYLWIVPYALETAPFLRGYVATAGITVLNETGVVLGNTTEVLALGGRVDGNATFLVSQTVGNDLLARAQTLTVRVELTLPGGLVVTNDRLVPWTPGGP